MLNNTVGVVGAGVMGLGVAESLAENDYDIVLMDKSEDVLAEAESVLRQNIRLHRMLRKSAKLPHTSNILERIRFSSDLRALSDVGYVIENISEIWDQKKDIYQALDRVCTDECIFAANTSAILIRKFAEVTNRPSQVVGIHFMNPVPLKDTVEVIRSIHTSDETIEITRSLLSGMKKRHVVVNDVPGFVSNRVMMLMVNEAILLVQDGVATPKDIDTVFVSCMGHAMGPLETSDLIGLDTIFLTLKVLQDGYGGEKFTPAPLLEQMVKEGRLGRKSGQGFFNYAI
ncbi:MAG: 3-hydroxyacyl-CoA dehydrogenase family protein [Proteobacteria bacterium]|nr:3-hydroxyacyl-CoA dehydrogenase family protein [Pseudomonadota bacterium]